MAEHPENHSSIQRVAFAEATAFWLKLGCVGFGGPAGQIALLHEEVVHKRGWISEARFLHALNYCMLLPGPEAQQLATYVGWLLHGTVGGIVAGALFVLPSLVLIVGVSWVYARYGDSVWVAGGFEGIKPAMIVIVAHAALRMGTRTLKHPVLWGIAVLAFAALASGRVSFPLLVCAGACAGGLGGRMWPEVFSPQGASSGELPAEGTGTRAHTAPSVKGFVCAAGTGLVLWALPMAVLWWVAGAGHLYVRMGWFFTKAALLTFGGAYAVLPYVLQAAVHDFGWVTPGEMMDGLALGESTPGPLIMVVVFVAFLGGWRSAPTGAEFAVLPAIGAALVSTWFTFLPSFVFILAGGPLVERTRKMRAFSGPLTAMRAAMVGVIGHLAWVFGMQVLWPEGGVGGLELRAAALALAAAVALFGFRRSVMEVIGASALVGLGLHAIGG